MGYYLTILRWTGSDQDLALKILNKVFRFGPEQGIAIMRKALAGTPWRFEHTLSDQQAPLAKSHLGNFGFVVELTPVSAYTNPASQEKNSETFSGPTTSLCMGFHGDGFELFKIQLANLLLIVVTLGVYSFWAKTRTRQYLYSNTSLGRDRFAYHGTAQELVKGQIKFVGMILIAGLVTGLVADSAPSLISGALNIASYIILSLVVPVLMTGALRYRLARTSLRGIRFSFRGQLKPAIILYVKGILLTGLTLGLYYPYFMIRVRKFVGDNSYFGNMPFTFDGKGEDVFRRFLWMVFLTIPTLGIYSFWYKAYWQNYIWSHTRIGDAKFRFTATGGDWCKLTLSNLFLLFVTFGVATPWVVVRNHRFIADHLALEGGARLDRAVQEMKNSGAMGDVASDDLDISIDAF